MERAAGGAARALVKRGAAGGVRGRSSTRTDVCPAIDANGGESFLGVTLSTSGTSPCVTDGAAVYCGAWWCPQCRRQSDWFEEHAGALHYFECHGGMRSECMNDECRDAGARAFPTWILGDGRELRGAQSPLSLAAATGCLGL